MENGCEGLVLDPTLTPECSCGLAPSKPLPVSSCPKPRLGGSKILIWFLLAAVMPCRGAALCSPVQLPWGQCLTWQCKGGYLEPAIQKETCTKHNLKHPCPAPSLSGKDSESISMFKFKPAPTKICWFGWDLPEPLPRALTPGGKAVPWAQAVLSSPNPICCPHLTTYIWQFSLGKHEELCWCSRCLVSIWMISRCTYIYIHRLKTLILS